MFFSLTVFYKVEIPDRLTDCLAYFEALETSKQSRCVQVNEMKLCIVFTA